MHLEPGKVKLIQQHSRIGMLLFILKVVAWKVDSGNIDDKRVKFRVFKQHLSFYLYYW